MAIAHGKSLMVYSLTIQLFFFLLTPKLIKAQSSSAPAPSPPGPINITAILEKGGQYTTFIRLLVKTQAGNQINNQLNSSTDGMTVFSPTDNAFTNLPAGALNKLNDQQQVQLIQYHILPKYYGLQNLETVSNPVRTQASGQNGQVFGLNFTGQGNQVNVSTGVVETQVNNALRSNFPLAVYQVDKVLLPSEFTRAKPPESAPPPGNGKSPSGSAAKKKPTEDGPASDSPPNDSGRINVRSGMVVGIGLFWLRLLF